MTAVAELRASCTTSEGIAVQVRCEHLQGHEAPEHARYVFIYHITISNDSDEDARLLGRHWDIIDANGRHQVVDAPGVVGKMPLLRAGESFSYSSFAPLATHWGTMEGWYHLERTDGSPFRIPVKRFHLIAD